jgi:EAL and modified HD-GYP domain-containing signal transduction protein
MCREQGGDRDAQDAAFMVGMFSLLDLLFACPLWEIVKPLSLSEEVRNALLEKSGPLGDNLRLTEVSDRLISKQHEDVMHVCELSVESYYNNLTHAYSWVNQVCQDM